jgi:transcriptional regulator with XRE-family HTH domain
VSKNAPYQLFGQRLIELRQAAGIPRQSDFAKRIKTSQQTVSRWEKGLSRPREKQLALIASVLEQDVDDLRLAAGYASKTVVATFDQPFPVDALAPEVFERFCSYLLQRLYPDASVHQIGGRGHTQDGTDIMVRMTDGTVYSFQCKRAEEFGPQKVHAAVSKHSVDAVKKFLVLSRVASPQARDAIAKHNGWDIWDKDDLSLKIRSLSNVDQISLVDIFFSGRRFELLGVTEEGVWETPAEFFAPFENTAGLFNHGWTLVGRKKALASLKALVSDQSARLVLLIGSGGSGKSRILKQAIETYAAKSQAVTIRFLARTAELTKKSLEQLGEKPSLLIVDDAHDRADLPLLFSYAASHAYVRLVLALRPYGVDHLKAQAGGFSLVDVIKEVSLEPMTMEEAKELATQVLKKEKGPLQAAKDIARLTYDCPLATVVGAQIVAREKKHFTLAANEDAFRHTLFGHFEKVIAGELGQKADAERIKRSLRVLALFQPFYIDDNDLLAAIERLENIPAFDALRLWRLLIEAGVLFKRGGRYRLSPDVLADYIIEDACVGAQGESTGYAEAAFDAAGERLIENILLNVGKLDWRLSDGDAGNSRLLDGLWTKLQPKSDYADPYIKAVEAVAFYQPARALAFGEDLIRRQKFTDQLSQIFKYAAYNLDHLPRACAALWELAKNDDREPNQHPSHPIRLLSELLSIEPNKPLAYSEAAVDFGLGLVRDPANWKFRHTPLDILSAIFSTEGHTTVSRGNAIAFNPFTINPKAVAQMRDRVFDTVRNLLGHPDIRIATRAAQSIGEALRGPIGLFNAKVSRSLHDKWTKIFCETLEKVERAVKNNTYDPLVLVRIAKSVSWHAHYGQTATRKIAQRIFEAMAPSLDYQVIAILVDGYGHELRRIDPENHDKILQGHLKQLGEQIIQEHPTGEKLRSYIARQLEHIKQGSNEGGVSPYIFYRTLMNLSPDLAYATIEDALSDPHSITVQFADDALWIVRSRDLVRGREIVKKFLSSGRDDLLIAAGRALASVNFSQSKYEDEERKAIKTLLTSNNRAVVTTGIYALRAVSRHNTDEALLLVRETNIGAEARLADELLCLLTFGSELPFSRLTEDDVESLLNKLMPVPRLDGHWTETFLANASKVFPDRTLEFFMQRVARAVELRTWDYRPVNHGPYVHVPLLFKDSSEYGRMLSHVIDWLASQNYDDDRQLIFEYRSRELFEAAFGRFDEEVVRYLDRWSETTDEAGFLLIANILRDAPHDFVFERRSLVMDLLTRARRASDIAYRKMNSALFGSAFGGLKSGTAGQPFPRDIETKRQCGEILSKLSKFSPAYELYHELLKQAEADIARAHRTLEEFED